MTGIRFVLLWLVLTASLPLYSQLILNDLGKAFGEEPFFNPAFIRQNKIARIIGEVSTKQEMKPIVKRYEYHVYHFLPNGNMQFASTIRGKQAQERDTAMVIFVYDPENRLTARRRSDAGGFYTLRYEWDAQDRVEREIYSRNQNSGNGKFNFVEGSEVIVNSERFVYREMENQLHKTTLNHIDKPYLQEISYFDDLGYLQEVSQRYIITNKSQKVRYTYNDKGLTASTTEISVQGDTLLQQFTYDERGNIMEVEVYKNGVYAEHREFLYYGDNMLLKAQLAKEIATNLIRIVQYTYEFRKD